MSRRKHNIQWAILRSIMQVVCSNCAARYAVDPLAIGPTGRTVQCVRCNHRWFETIKADTPIVEPPAPEIVSQPQPTYTSGLPVLATPRRTVHWGRWITAGVVLLLVLGAALFTWREEIAGRLSGEWRTNPGADAARGSSVVEPARPSPPAIEPSRLKIDLAASKIELVGSRYVVRGELVNSGQREASTRIIKLVFRKGDDVLGERVYTLVEGPVAPGGRLAFSRPLDDPPEGTTNIVPSVE